MNKQQLRNIVSEKLSQAVPTPSEHNAISQRLGNLPIYHASQTICMFYPQKKEPDIRLLFVHEKGIVLPVILGEKLILRRYISEKQLTKNKYGIMEPDSTCPSIVTASIDLFIIPGVAFGLDGYRLGHGKGYYDRLLSNTKSPVIGICFDSQVFATVPHSANDGKVDIIVTEKQTYDLKNHHTPYKPFS